MIALLLAASVQIACTNCNGVGYFEYACPKCSGSGVVSRSVKKKLVSSIRSKDFYIPSVENVACRECSRGSYSLHGKSTGKIRKNCPVCKGLKKIRKPVDKRK